MKLYAFPHAIVVYLPSFLKLVSKIEGLEKNGMAIRCPFRMVLRTTRFQVCCSFSLQCPYTVTFCIPCLHDVTFSHLPVPNSLFLVEVVVLHVISCSCFLLTDKDLQGKYVDQHALFLLHGER